MAAAEQDQITQLLREWRNGDPTAFERLLPCVYAQLHHLASNHMRKERENHLLQTTALIHEAWLRLVDEGGIDWQNRAHFYAIAATTMRHILVDFARKEKRVKRGGGRPHLDLDQNSGLGISEESFDEVLTINDALDRLGMVDERKVKVVEMRFFGGMSVEETAEVLGVSENTVVRDWSLARAWLRRELQVGGTPSRIEP